MYYYGTIGEAYYHMATDTSRRYRTTLNSLSKNEKTECLSKSLVYLLKAVETGKQIEAPKQMINWYTDISDAYRNSVNGNLLTIMLH